MQQQVASGELDPMQAKKNLAFTITQEFHTREEAQAAAENWSLQFQTREVASDLPIVTVSLGAEGLLADSAEESVNERVIRISKLLQLSGLADSAAEANRKIAEGAVSIDNQRFTGRTLSLRELGTSPVMRLGKKVLRVVFEPQKN